MTACEVVDVLYVLWLESAPHEQMINEFPKLVRPIERATWGEEPVSAEAKAAMMGAMAAPRTKAPPP